MKEASGSLSYGSDSNGQAVELSATNVIVTGSSGSGATITMRSLVADAISKGWRVALASPKYREDADYPGDDDDDLVDMAFYSEGREPEDVAFGLGCFIDSIPTGMPDGPRLVILDDFQSTVGGFEKAERRSHSALDRLLDDPDTTVVLRMKALSPKEVSQHLSRRIGAVISMGRLNQMNAIWSMAVAKSTSPESQELLTQLDPEVGRGVLLTQGAAQETFTPFVRNVSHE